MRPYWKGYLKLALVSCPIALHAACSTTERIAFRQINKGTGNRFRSGRIGTLPVSQSRISPVAGDWVVELVGLEPTTRVLWNMGVSDQLTRSDTRPRAR